ncbi:Lupus La like protein [Astathelohania contejeani]|uniref:Lupus La like protein n=1 Tax=Astathelohania contejeani TaxID=164912 RepID=A0ABQ7HY55_9MICR|nr:Lupus La like protein [Thelohania contejeani]
MTESNKIKKQIEFYFSDANYRVDKFLKEEALKNEGWVSVDTILTFKRMRDLCATKENVEEALKDSSVAEYKDGKIKKIETEEYKKYIIDEEVDKRIVYIKGLDADMTLDDIEEFLKKYCEPVLIRMRKDKTKKFKGSIFVELKSEEEAKKLIETKIPIEKMKDNITEDEDNKKRIKLAEDTVYLTIMSKHDYFENEKKSKEEMKKENARKEFLKDCGGKFYRYETKKDMDIKEIKASIEGIAFVDTVKNILRFKKPQEFVEKEIGDLKLIKLQEEDENEYSKNINIKPKKNGNKKKGK